ncbi:MAG TPA: MBL fold metallo-hydrolase [Solirubrobacterales bacterium]|nr:MBL fold metallo-hydrolase [Solirubrobacterales bacterium]
MTILGSGGWIPTSARATCCAVVRQDDYALIIDAGTGLARIGAMPDLLAGVEEIDLVLTHFHLDHVVGLGYVPGLNLPVAPRIHGPGDWLYATATERLLSRLCEPPLFPAGLESITDTVRELGPEGGTFGPFQITVREQPLHSNPTAGIRVDDILSYCTDTAQDPGTVGFASGSKVLLHDAWFTQDAPRDEGSHTSGAQAAELADAAGVQRLILIHINPAGNEQALLDEAAAIFPQTELGTDNMILE